MPRIRKKQTVFLKVLRFLFVSVCLGGFLYQTSQFLFLYWTYPTVVDIQQIEPSYLEVPAFSICNSLGYNYDELCHGFNSTPCLPSAFNRFSGSKFCNRFPEACFDGKLPEDLQVVTFNRFMKETELTPKDHEKLRVKLEDYMNCTIEFADQISKCDLENVMGSFYSKEDLPQYCYAIYSKWGNPYKKRSVIPKGAVMHFHFVLNSTLRSDNTPKPKYNIPSSPSVQIAIHSPYFLPSPFLDGMSYIGGRAYEVRLKMNERHLLPAPYQTNCTDYMSNWYARGGRGPINQMGAVQECRVNKTFQAIGCIPLSLDYPHTYNICKSCSEGPCNDSTFTEECGKLADNYTQPCYALSYSADREDKVITTFVNIDSSFLQIKETVRKKLLAYDCEGSNVFSKECSTIDVDILFDRYEITNLTYNPKFESLEIFSAIGGYMGMWLGISLLTVYDFIGSIILMIRAHRKKGEKNKLKKMKRNKIDKSSYFSTNYRTKEDGYRAFQHHNLWGMKNY